MAMGINFKELLTDFKDMMATTIEKAKEFIFRQNSSVDSEGGFVGSGLLEVHESRGNDKRNLIAKKKREKESSHQTLMTRLQKRINELQAQIKVLQGKIDELNEEKTENKDEIAKNKERMEQLKAEGEENSPEYLALLAANDALNDRNNDIDIEIIDHQDRVDGLKQKVSALEGELSGLKAEAHVLAPEIQKTLKEKDGGEIVNIATANAVGAKAKAAMDEAKGHENEDLSLLITGRTENNIAAVAGEDSRTENKAIKDNLFSSLGFPNSVNLTPTQPKNIITENFNLHASPVHMDNVDMGIAVANVEPREIPVFTSGGSNQDVSQGLTVQTLGS